MARREAEQQTVMGFAFKAKKPKRGTHFVCLKRRRFYGTVRTVRPDRTFKYIGPYGLVMDSRREGMTWETVQYDKKGEFRFVEALPEDFHSLA